MLEIISGWDVRQPIGFNVSTFSAIRRTSEPIRFTPLIERALRWRGLYKRPHEEREGQIWCPISGAAMSTPFAISRFLVPWLSDQKWALYVDGTDMLWVDDPAKLFALADERFAVMCVQRDEYVADESTKMSGAAQAPYPRKGWSSVCLWNLAHRANKRLKLEDVNSRPGRELHAFYWLRDSEIGSLPLEWNYLAGIDPVGVENASIKPSLIHYTEGTVELLGNDEPWSDIWRQELAIMDATRPRIRAA